MIGFPKRLNTNQDIMNCIDLVKIGKLSAIDMVNELTRLINSMYIKLPIVSKLENEVTIVHCSEIEVGMITRNGMDILKIENSTPNDDNIIESSILTFENPYDTDYVEIDIFRDSIETEYELSLDEIIKLREEMNVYE